jgi:uncharacterized SAM-binding protein YcdF (DUF218 family)
MKVAKGKKRVWIAGAGLALVLLAVFAANAGSVLVVDAPARSDVIVVLAGEANHRPAKGLELLRQGFGRRVILDVPAAPKIYEFTEVQMAEKYVQGLPEAASIQVCPIEGLSTRDEARDVAGCLAHVEGSRILIVTSDFHTRRALSIFRHEIPGKTSSAAAARDSAQFGTRWWRHRQWAKVCEDEWLRLLWWELVDRWR